MSHFTVLVIGNNPKAQLKPYDENKEVPPYKAPITHDEIVRCLEHYSKEGKIKEITVAKGKVLKPSYPMVAKLWKNWNNNTLGLATDGTYYEWKTYNPRSKWDRYQLGGRWRGYFKLVDAPRFPKVVRVGEGGTFDNLAKAGWYDQLMRCDVDIVGMREEARKKAEEVTTKVREATKDLPFAETWEVILDRYKDNIDVARSIYHTQPWIKALTKANLVPWNEEAVTMFQDLDAYIHRQVAHAISTFAVVKDGEWYERDSMGWWGIVTDKKNETEWEEQFNQLFDTIPEDTLLSIYDCHI